MLLVEHIVLHWNAYSHFNMDSKLLLAIIIYHYDYYETNFKLIHPFIFKLISK